MNSLSLPELLSLLSVLITLLGGIFVIGKLAQIIHTNTSNVRQLGRKVDDLTQHNEKRFDEISIFLTRVDQRVAELQRFAYSPQITDRLRSGEEFRFDDEDEK
jgi:hypothetical protein